MQVNGAVLLGISSLSNRWREVCRCKSPCARHRVGSAICRHLMRCTATRQQAHHRAKDGRMQRLVKQIPSAGTKSPCVRRRVRSAIFRHLVRCTATRQQAQHRARDGRMQAAACVRSLGEDFCRGVLTRGGVELWPLRLMFFESRGGIRRA